MSFYSKGDFKIQNSWDTRDKDSKSRNSKRKDSHGTQSLMKQLANNISEPSTDLIDDSLSKLLAKEREQPYGAIPKARKQTPDLAANRKSNQLRTKVEPQDNDVVASMANRLQKLQKTCQSQRQQIKEQKQTIEKIKTENAFLKAMKQDSTKVYSEMNDIKTKNVELEKKVVEMQAYLKQYGLKWVGYKVEGKLDDKSIKKQIKQSKYAYRLPSEIDIVTIKRRVQELNAGLQEQGMGTQIYNQKGVHKFRKSEYLPIGFYSNGIVIKGFNFYNYKSKESLKILADILDGYFPYIFKAKYPNGVLLQVVDHIEQQYIQQKKEEKFASLSSDKDFEPMSRQQFLNKLPQQVIKDGKVIPIRGEIQKMFDGKKSTENNESIINKDGVLFIKTQCWQLIQKGQYSQSECCLIKVRLETGETYIVKMFKSDKVIDIMTELRKILQAKFNLITNYPRCTYTGEESEKLQDLGFYPNQNLLVQVIK